MMILISVVVGAFTHGGVMLRTKAETYLEKMGEDEVGILEHIVRNRVEHTVDLWATNGEKYVLSVSHSFVPEEKK